MSSEVSCELIVITNERKRKRFVYYQRLKEILSEGIICKFLTFAVTRD